MKDLTLREAFHFAYLAMVDSAHGATLFERRALIDSQLDALDVETPMTYPSGTVVTRGANGPVDYRAMMVGAATQARQQQTFSRFGVESPDASPPPPPIPPEATR